MTLATLWIVAHQTPLSMGFSRQDYWSGFQFPSPGHLPHPETKPVSSTLTEGSLPLIHHRSPKINHHQVVFVIHQKRNNSNGIHSDFILSILFFLCLSFL